MMLLRWKMIVPVLSVSTAGVVAYPLVSSRSNGSSNSIISPTNTFVSNQSSALSYRENYLSDTFLSFTPGNVSTFISSEAVNQSKPLERLNISGSSGQIDVLQNDGLSFDAEAIVDVIRREISKGQFVEDISESQIRQFKEAVQFIEDSEQGYGIAAEIVKDYGKSSLLREKQSTSITLQESQKHQFTKKHRESIHKFYLMYSKLESYKIQGLQGLKGASEGFSFPLPHQIVSEEHKFVENSLDRIDWSGKDIKIFFDAKDLGEWGWGGWNEQNPYYVFYEGKEQQWRTKMQKIKDSEEILESNAGKGELCSTSDNPKRNKALQEWCKMDKRRLIQLVKAYKSEVELDIATWLLKKMKQIQARYRRR